MKFIDEIEIVLSSGKGGAGKVSFRREAMTPRGGPDGGDGGRGGDVVIRARNNVNSLVDFRHNKRYSAQDGGNGEASNCTGAYGEPLEIVVPKGTIFRAEDGHVLVDMTDKDEHTLLPGGRGGKGNTFFKNSVNQAPEKAQPGEPGIEIRVKMELKLIADVGIMGLPNAGKSTLISRLSAARPKIADYPFTTLTPNLGVVKLAEFRSMVLADIPGLIRGAHQGVGLGIQFLKHIERTRMFVHLLDVSSNDIDEIIKNYRDINYELEMYDQQNQGKDGFFPLSDRPQLIVFNKIDTLPKEDVDKLVREFENRIGENALAISAVSGKNIDVLKRKLEAAVFPEVTQE